MDTSIALILLQDGVVNGAIYALLALCLVLVFAVTRVIFIPQGELVAFAALTYAALHDGRVPGSVWLLAGLGAGAFLAGAWGMRFAPSLKSIAALGLETLAIPALVIAAALAIGPTRPAPWLAAILTLAVVAPMAPYLYRLAFQPMAEASVLTLLIASVGVHLALVGLGLVFFGPEGFRGPSFSDMRLTLGPLLIPGQALWILAATAIAMLALFAFFEFTLFGKALRATAVNRLGARLVGIGTGLSGRIAFLIAGGIGAVSGILIAPLTTIYYDSGFLVGLKGFVAAIIGGLVSYPVAVLAALVVGCVESVSSFYASAFKEVIVFTVIIPVLLWRSFRGGEAEE